MPGRARRAAGLWLAPAALLLWWLAPAEARTFGDPVAYCRAVGTIDRPDARYAGPKLPPWMAAKLGLPPDAGERIEWRCARGAVLACVYGANLPCGSKAVTSRRPTAAITRFCRENPDARFVPMVVTGHETVVSWRCRGKRPMVAHVGATDAQGYAIQYWKRVAP